MSKRRKPGDTVRRSPGSGFLGAAEPSLLRISEGELPDPCILGCGDPDCQEWANLEILEGEFKGEFLYHISECCLGDP